MSDVGGTSGITSTGPGAVADPRPVGNGEADWGNLDNLLSDDGYEGSAEEAASSTPQKAPEGAAVTPPGHAPAVAAGPQGPAPAGAQAAQQPQVSPTSAQEPAVGKAEPTQEQQGAQPAPASAETIAGIVEQLKTQREPLLKGLAEGVYGLSEDEAIELETSPHTFVPKLAAKIQFNAAVSAANLVNRMYSELPKLVGEVFAQQQQAAQQRDAFYGKFPALKDAKYLPQIGEVWGRLQAAFPQYSPAQLSDAVGQTLMAANGLWGQAQQPQAAVPKASPYAPPRAAVGGPPPAQPPEPWFAGLMRDYDE